MQSIQSVEAACMQDLQGLHLWYKIYVFKEICRKPIPLHPGLGSSLHYADWSLSQHVGNRFSAYFIEHLILIP